MQNNKNPVQSRDGGASMQKSEGISYQEALGLLKNGHTVKLPEWGGIWFQIGDKIFVFTKDGELLDTPDHETYGKRDDWTLKLDTVRDIPIKFVKTLRQRADNTLDYIKTALPKNRETSLAATSAQLGFMWLGLLLADLGAANPYPKSSDPSSPVIEPHADKAIADHLAFINELPDETAKVKALRAEIQLTVDMIKYITGWGGYTHGNSIWPAMGNFIEAKLWLGQELNNIRIAQEGQKS